MNASTHPSSSATMSLPKKQMEKTQAEWRAFWAVGYIFLPHWQNTMKASKNKAHVARGHFQTNPENAYETAKTFKKYVAWAIGLPILAIIAGYCGYSLTGVDRLGYISIVCFTVALLVGAIAFFHIKGNVLGGWPGFTVFQLAKAWKPVRETLKKSGAIESIIASFQYGNIGRGGPDSVILNSKEDEVEIMADVHYALKKIADAVKEAESEGRPLLRRREKARFIELFEVASMLNLLRGKKHDDFFKNY